MTIEEFTRKLEAEFEDVEAGSLTTDTHFKNIKGWSSMYALIIIAFADANCGVLLTGNDLKTASTVSDLYGIIKSKGG